MSAPKPADKIQVASISDRGLSEKRPMNEDSFLADAGRGIFVVADGVGGADAGEVASQKAVDVLNEAFRDQVSDGEDVEDLMELAIQRANSAIHQMAAEHPRFSMMATTVVALHLDGSRATIGHVGDSRLYRLNPDGKLLRETDDHSIVEEEVRAVRTVPRKVYLLPANGRTFYYAFQLQPDGALSGSANFCPAHDVELFEAATRGDLKRAKELHDRIFPIFRRVYCDPYVYLHIRYKYCAWLLGKISSPALRSPLVPLPADEVKVLKEGLRASGLEPVR